MKLFDRIRTGARTREQTPTGSVSPSENQAESLIVEGNMLEDAGRLVDALGRYDAAVHLAPAFARAHLNRGNVLLALGDNQGAVAAYATALLHDPANGVAHYNLGNAYVRSNRREDARLLHARQPP